MNNWWQITNEKEVDTPFLAVYEERMAQNMQLAIAMMQGELQRFRPHIKTHKTGEILALFKVKGIEKIKCATIAEAELAGMYGVKDILMAYQPVGQKLNRFIQLILKYSDLAFSCFVDNLKTVDLIQVSAAEFNITIKVYLDLNTGMNRTGIAIEDDYIAVAKEILNKPNLHLEGFHIYDGHLKSEITTRLKEVSESFSRIQKKIRKLESEVDRSFKIVAGGSNTFPFYAKQTEVECSPGTFVFWDDNYSLHLPEQKFSPAALVVGTLISQPTSTTFCVDIGYKSIASENPIEQRIRFLNAPDLIPIGHSEEHLVVANKGTATWEIGDLVYGLPYHICPTVNLYETLQIINSENKRYTQWNVLARNKKISI
ncbi:D-TA family PLP-dependent enzyme [Flavobacterium agrisoli]|uniref:D-TA family PLP-dependent enzyme n=1 Tax=Flavobacterium agrisoli TaxID=2793066 RepID=A0A934PKE2_9FLAO|nr:D-TA family PLP-dependent enzyme [Flavobacterium agrisoli]MBK0369792.1 D-TA family PLP-dependent enzyme [Flavobacterium agrisoli]